LLSFIKKTKSQFLKGFSIFWKERDAYMKVDQLLTQYLTK